jgi:hypothetical protein
MPAPRVGLILGGPVARDATYGPFAGLHDYGPTRWRVEQTLTDPEGRYRVVRLKFVHGYLRPWYAVDRTRFDQDEWEKVNNAGRPYFVWDPQAYITPPSATVNHFGYFPNLRARLTTAARRSRRCRSRARSSTRAATRRSPRPSFQRDHRQRLGDLRRLGRRAVSVDRRTVRRHALQPHDLSGDNPLLLAGHPVDVVAYAAALSDVPIDAASPRGGEGGDRRRTLVRARDRRRAEVRRFRRRRWAASTGSCSGRTPRRAPRVRGDARAAPAPQFTITDADRVSANERRRRPAARVGRGGAERRQRRHVHGAAVPSLRF